VICDLEVWIKTPDGEQYDVLAHWRECLAHPSADDFVSRQEVEAVIRHIEDLAFARDMDLMDDNP
jgi:hypothetical protein